MSLRLNNFFIVCVFLCESVAIIKVSFSNKTGRPPAAGKRLRPAAELTPTLDISNNISIPINYP